MKHLLYIILLFISPEILASIFTPATNDESITLLGLIFGANVGSISLGANAAANQAISDVMTQLNIVIVALGTIVVSYVGIMSTINTAHEGSAMGKKWSAVWVPMRSVSGMALLIPSSGSGYSMIQVTVMYIVMQGIGAADYLWNVILGDLSNGVSIVSGSSTSSSPALPTGNVPTTVQGQALGLNLLNALVCMQTLRMEATGNPDNINPALTWLGQYGTSLQMIPPTTSQNPVTPVQTASTGNPVTSVTVTGTMNFGVPNNSVSGSNAVCGSIVIEGTASTKDFPSGYTLDPQGTELANYATQIYSVKATVVNTILNNLQTVATSIVAANPVSSYDAQPPAPPYSLNSNPAGLPQGMATTIGQQYVNELNIPVPQNSEGSSPLQQAIASGEANGWISAGSFYFVFSQTVTSQIFSDLSTPPTTGTIGSSSGPSNIPVCTNNGTSTCQTTALSGASDPGGLGDKSNPPSGPAGQLLKQIGTFVTNQDDIDLLAVNLALANQYWATATGSNSVPLTIPGTTGGNSGPLQQILSPLVQSENSTITALIALMNNLGNGDPLIAHALFGQGLMFTCELAWIAMTVASLIISMVVGFLGIEMGWSVWLLGLIATLSGVLGSLWVFGATLAVYCPLIPFMIFTMGALGWLLLVTEAVIGGPIVALSLVVPSQDELGEIKAALMLLANIFLRPTLMLLGFALAGRLYKAAVMLVGFGFGPTLNAINIGTLFSPIVVLGTYTAFIVSLTNNCFSLIYTLPDKILRWMGGPSEQTDASALGDAKAGASGAAGKVGAEGGGMGQAAGARVSDQQDKQQKRIGEAKADARAAGKSTSGIKDPRRGGK